MLQCGAVAAGHQDESVFAGFLTSQPCIASLVSRNSLSLLRASPLSLQLVVNSRLGSKELSQPGRFQWPGCSVQVGKGQGVTLSARCFMAGSR